MGWFKTPAKLPDVHAQNRSLAVGRDNINSPTTFGLDEDGVRTLLREELARIAVEKGVPEAPLQEVLKRLGETGVALSDIPARLATAADELIRLRADLVRLRNDRPEFAALRARASGLIDRGDFDGARAELQKGRAAARAQREELARSEAGFLADEARLDALQLNYGAATRKFAAGWLA